MPKERVLIVGGGVAGIAAALRIAEAGIAPIILETRNKLGGRATSFEDPRTGHVLDNCQHITLGCCTNYLDLLSRMGAGDLITWHEEIHWIERGGRTSVMKPSPIAGAPAHYGGSFAHMKFLTAHEKVSIARAMFRIMRADRSRYTDITFETYLAGSNNAPKCAPAIAKFWEPIVVSACNISVSKVAASCAMHVIQEGFLASRQASRMGVPSVPLAQLYAGAVDAIQRTGGEVRLSTGVERIDNGVVRMTSGVELCSDKIICALPFERALQVVDDELQMGDPRFEMMKRITHSPILGVHLHFDRPILSAPQATLVGMGTQWIFAKDAPSEAGGGQLIHAVVSGADEWMTLDEQQIVNRVMDDLRICLDGVDDAELISARGVKEKRATIAPTPECESNRPAVIGEHASSLVLGGDYVDTGWPSTMEGAARSGYMAAAAVLGEALDSFVIPPLMPEYGVRVLGGGSLKRQAELAKK